MSKRSVYEMFCADVKDHQLVSVEEHGIVRHLRFSNPRTNHAWFDLVTWPGSLCIRGDCGTYVFSRIEDMFAFFRSKGELKINRGYWSEKVEAMDRHGLIEQYDEDKARDAVNRWAEDLTEGMDDAARTEFNAELAEALEYHWENEYELRSAIDSFDYDGIRFTDFFEVNLKEYSLRFEWCCWAIVWGIRKYDEWKEAQA